MGTAWCSEQAFFYNALKMRILPFTLFLFAVTRRHTCLNLIDLPFNFQSDDFVNQSDDVAENSEAAVYYDESTHSFNARKAAKTPKSPVYLDRNFYISKLGVTRKEASYKPRKNANAKTSAKSYPPIRTTQFNIRKYFHANNDGDLLPPKFRALAYEDEKNANLKAKISTLIQQTIHDTDRKIKSVSHIREKHRNEAPYRAGFILSMIKKTRDMLNELFNVAVKHKDEWKALEQLKIFELIVHTNVDLTHLVRQLVEIHIQHLNSTNPEPEHKDSKRRVVLLK